MFLYPFPMNRFFLIFLVLLPFGLPAQQPAIRILHYTETTGYDHNTRNQSATMFQSWAVEMKYAVTSDDEGDEFNSLENLLTYAVVIFSNTSGNSGLSASQRANFEAYIAAGGSYLGIHAASDTYRHGSSNGGSKGTWDWYAETVAGASVQQSPNHTSQNHQNTMTHSQAGHPILASLPDPWNKTEEYYYWEKGFLAEGFTELLRVGSTGSNSHDAPRMMAHCRELPGGGRSFYTALGHAGSNFSGNEQFRALIKDALQWLLEAPAALLIQEQAWVTSWKVFPNPATKRLTIAASLAQSIRCEVILLDLQGRELQRSDTKKGRELSWEMSLDSIPQGTYFLRLTGEGAHQTKVIQVE